MEGESSSRKQKVHVENEKSTQRQWENLPHDVLLKIFASFSLMELILSFSMVCKSWRSMCSDPSLWGTSLDLSVLSNYLCVPSKPFAWCDQTSQQKLMFILRNALSLNRGNFTDVIFHFYIYITDYHLVHTAQRCPNVKRLILPTWNWITTEGFERAVQNWTKLECLMIPCIQSPHDIMKLLSENCENFRELKLMCPFDLDLATSITKFLPKLKILSLRCAILHKNALEHILEKMEHLEVLNIKHCLVVYIPVARRPIQIFVNLNTRILQRASRLRELFTCDREACRVCDREFYEEGTLTWHQYEEGLWREDEVGSLAY